MQPDDDRTQTHLPLASNALVGHYRIIEKIGAGGMGEVYLAEDTQLNRKVALKFLPLHLCQDSDCRARFKREAQAAAKLDHPNIVGVYEVGEHLGRPFFSMQHVEGLSLKEHTYGKDLSLSQVIEIAVQACEGLAAAHEAGVIHRDIKPSNILIDSHGRARIVDFGLAAIKGADHLTKTGSTLGTLGYMSPEQVRGEPVDHRSDLFSFGIVLYELIAGKAPFVGDSEAATLKNVVDKEPEPLARYKSGVPEELQRIINKALTKDKRLRYQHADELSADLKRLISATGGTPFPSRRRRLRVVVPSAVGVIIIAVLLVLKPWRIVIEPTEVAQASTNRVVVVPFQNQTGDPTLDPLGKMVADWTTQTLMQTGLAEVVPPEVYPTFDARTGLKPIIEATGAKMVVTGSYYRIGDSLQFQAQVMSGNGTLLQAIEPVYVQKVRVMEGVEEVRQKTVGGLAVLLDDRTLGTSARTSKPPKYEAYKEFMQGRSFHVARNDSAALAHYERAYALDTTFLEPVLFITAVASNLGRVARMDSAVQLLQRRRDQLTTLQQYKLDEAAAEATGNKAARFEASRKGALLAPGSNFSYMRAYNALALNRPAECLEALKDINPYQGWARGFRNYWSAMTSAYHQLGQHEKELEAAREARKICSDHPGTLFYEARALIGKGDIEAAELVLEQLLVQPLVRPQANIGAWTEFAAAELRRHGHEELAMKWQGRAIQWYESGSAIELKDRRAYYAGALYNARRWQDARQVFEALLAETPNNLEYKTYLGWIAARIGDSAAAKEVSDWLKDFKRPYLNGLNTYYRACIASILGRRDEAVALLTESFQQGYGSYEYIHRDVDLEALWDYPPFIELMKPKG